MGTEVFPFINKDGSWRTAVLMTSFLSLCIGRYEKYELHKKILFSADGLPIAGIIILQIIAIAQAIHCCSR